MSLLFRSHILGVRPDFADPGWHRVVVRPWTRALFSAEDVKGARGAVDTWAGPVIVEWTVRQSTAAFSLNVTAPLLTPSVNVQVPMADATHVPVCSCKGAQYLGTVNVYGSLFGSFEMAGFGACTFTSVVKP